MQTTNAFHSIRFADVTGDGLPDLITVQVAGGGVTTVVLQPNLGNCTFGDDIVLLNATVNASSAHPIQAPDCGRSNLTALNSTTKNLTTPESIATDSTLALHQNCTQHGFARETLGKQTHQQLHDVALEVITGDFMGDNGLDDIVVAYRHTNLLIILEAETILSPHDAQPSAETTAQPGNGSNTSGMGAEYALQQAPLALQR